MYRYYNNFGNGEAAARAFLGVVSKDNDKGAEITGVNENTPASKAGLQKGDIITRVGDKEVKDPSSLLEAVRANKPNDEVEVSYLRDGKQKKSKVKLGETKEVFNEFKFEMPEMPAMPKMDFHFDDNWADEFKGNMDEFKREFRLNEGDGPMTWNMQPRPRLGAKISDLEEGDGAKVLEVETEMAGAKAGLQKDDVITEIDGKAIRNTDDAREALKELKDKNAYQVKIKRGNDTKTLDVKIPKKIKTANL
jgi:serine protease Do